MVTCVRPPLLTTTYYLPSTTYDLLHTTCYLLPTTYYLLPNTYYLLTTNYKYHLLPIICVMSIVVALLLQGPRLPALSSSIPGSRVEPPVDLSPLDEIVMKAATTLTLSLSLSHSLSIALRDTGTITGMCKYM